MARADASPPPGWCARSSASPTNAAWAGPTRPPSARCSTFTATSPPRSEAIMSETDLAEFMRRNVQKFADLKPLEVGPPDRVLERFQRDRFSVIGRPDERPNGDQGANLGAPFNIGYIRCE